MIVLVLVGKVVVLGSQEGAYPANSRICDSLNKDDDRKKLECRESISGGLECRKESACTNMHCGDDNVARRAGMTCDGFPGYNGGHPISSKLVWDDENEEYNCLEHAVSGYCHRWETIEESPGEYELGECVCSDPSALNTSARYCSRWTCSQRETKKCSGGCTGLPSQRFPTSCRCRRSCDTDGGSSRRRRRRSTRLARRCQEEYTYEPETEWEDTEGECTRASRDGSHCMLWTQVENNRNGRGFEETEKYACTDSRPGYCNAWEGNINSKEEFEFSECKCRDVANNSCHEWTCYERGMTYFYPNLLWLLLSLPVQGGSQLGAGWATRNRELGVFWLVQAAVVAAINLTIGISFIWMAGIGELLIRNVLCNAAVVAASIALGWGRKNTERAWFRTAKWSNPVYQSSRA